MAGLNGTPVNGWVGAHASEEPVQDSTAGDEVPTNHVDLTRDWSGLLPAEGASQDLELELEHARFEAEIAAARARVAIAKHRSAAVSAALRAEVLASQEELAQMERAHLEAIEEIRASAQMESAQILAAARREAAAIAATVEADDQSEAHHGQ